jgi:hypothetical protein
MDEQGKDVLEQNKKIAINASQGKGTGPPGNNMYSFQGAKVELVRTGGIWKQRVKNKGLA